jgi:NAD(P)-dependent dehydrogenase (short-subunit alcohol dehydrogenase family)
VTEQRTGSGDGRVAVVSGGASGFGAAVAARCAAAGMSVVIMDVDGGRAAATAHELEGRYGVRVLALGVDVGDAAAVDDAAAQVAAAFDRCDVLFANVGVQQFGSVLRLSDDDWTWVLDVNIVGTARTVRSFLPLLMRSIAPRLAITASSSVLAPAARLGAYQASKFGVLGLAETLRIELAETPVSVSVVFPSGMATRHLESSVLARPAERGASTTAPDDLDAMLASSSFSAADFASPEDAAFHVLDDVLAGEPYIITHGDLDGAADRWHRDIGRALRLVGERWDGDRLRARETER